MKKFILSVILIFIITGIKAQNKIYHVIDSITNQPIGKVSVLSSLNNQGNLTNDDGDVKMVLNQVTDTLNFSFIGYNTLKLFGSNLYNKDTIKLSASAIILKDVNVFSLDLKLKIANSIKTYFNNYTSKPTSYFGTYKESFFLNDTLARLNQVQLNWYNKVFRYKSNADFVKENQISILNIDFSKSFDDKKLFANGLSVNNYDFFKYQFINFHKFLIDECGNINIDSVINYKNEQKVVFSAICSEKGVPVFKIKKGVFYFEKNTNAIIKIKMFFDYFENKLTKKSETTGKDYFVSVETQSLELAFKKIKSKWYLSYFKSNLKGSATFENETNSINSMQELLITDVERGKKIPKKNRVDLTQSLYKNLPVFKKLDAKIMLTKEERNFIEK